MNASHYVALAATGLLLVAVHTDLRRREIPDLVSVALVGLGVAAAWWGWHAVSLSRAGLGLAIGFGLGATLFYLDAMGGGDAKLAAGLGALCGWPMLVEVLFATALAGGLLSLWARRRGRESVAYAPAFAAGYVATVAIGAFCGHDGLWHWITGRPW